MANEHRINSEEDVEEILKLAIRQSHESTTDLKLRLQQTATELGIAPEAIARAEQQYFQGKTIKEELREYDEERRRSARLHLISYIAVNLGLLGINLLTALGDRDPSLWALYPLMGWGIGLMIHLGSVYFTKPSVTDDEFLSWRRRRNRALRGEGRRSWDDDDDDDDDDD